jgi:transportin-3
MSLLEMDSIKQMVIQASTTFYSTQDREQRCNAEQWLNDFKKSVHAWYVTDQILHTDKNEQVLFFAAQTIRTKIQYNFHELPIDSHEVSKNCHTKQKILSFFHHHHQLHHYY